MLRKLLMIAGYKDISLIDYPGLIAPVVFVGGCNFRCPFCHNADLVLNPAENEEFSIDNVLNRIENSKALAGGVVITGGEPTLWQGLEGFIHQIRNMNLKVKLDTNGSQPDTLEHLITQGLLDYVAMDIKTSLPRYPEASGIEINTLSIQKSIEVLINSGIPREFRTTCVPSLVSQEDVFSICQMLGQGEKYTLQYFQPVNTIDPAYSQIKPYPPEEMEKLLSIVTVHGLTGKII